MKRVLLASAAAMVMVGSAYAAEPLLEPLPPVTPTVVEPFVVPSWAGTYVGADIGYGWGDFSRNDGFFDDDDDDGFEFDDDDGLFDDDDELDGLVGGIFAGWLGQAGSFLYGVELYGQLAGIDRGDDDDGIFDDDDDGEFRRFDRCNFFTDGFNHARACRAHRVEVDGLVGLEGMIGWGGDRAAFLLHAGPVLGFFSRDDEAFFDANFNDSIDDGEMFRGNGDDGETELGVSLAAEGRWKFNERWFAGVIGRAAWFPDIGDNDDNGLFDDDDVDNLFRNVDDDTDFTVFEVKARIGFQFGGVGKGKAAAPVLSPAF